MKSAFVVGIDMSRHGNTARVSRPRCDTAKIVHDTAQSMLDTAKLVLNTAKLPNYTARISAHTAKPSINTAKLKYPPKAYHNINNGLQQSDKLNYFSYGTILLYDIRRLISEGD